ncbi:MAG: sulfite exporter TauE/SafE family protein [Clostridiales bacterium]|nr:sulfite exporter TauE/SafE family protein [Clostridiales bacterium]
MDSILQLLNFDWTQWIAIILAAFMVGFAKTAIGGVTILVIPILAVVFGGKDSSGIMLSMLLVGDLFAIWYYRKNVEWKNVFTPLPWAIIGLLLGVFVGNYISDKAFIMLIGIIVLFCLVILIYTERRENALVVPNKAWFYIFVGILSGFSSMIGNAAGPIFSIYLLALGFKKNNYMGTNAWFFFIVNVLKLPFQIFVWHTIGLKTLSITIAMIPIITSGAIFGYFALKKINERHFRNIVIAMTAIAAIKLLIE